MTVTYTAEVATCRGFGCFLKLLFRWRGSIYKLVWPDLVVFLLIYFSLSFIYRFVLNEDQKRIFENIAQYCETYSNLIPLSFVLGFYVSVVMQRWWGQYTTIPWPDSIAVFVSSNIHGQDDRGRLMRRTIMRYVCMCLTMVFTMISPRVKKRFPTLEHFVEAGLLLENEKKIIEDLNEKFPRHSKHWLPIVWAASIVTRARKEGRIRDDFAVKTIIDEINKFRGRCGRLLSYDTISIPLVYTQVVTLAVYSFFITCIMGRQWLDIKQEETTLYGPRNDIDLYFPIFTTLQIFIYVGWYRVPLMLLNPFGDDDDDFEVNRILDRDLQVSYLIVDEMHHEHPELIKDQYWDEVFPTELPYTVAAEQYREHHPEHSTAKIDVPEKEAEYAIPSSLQSQEHDYESAHGSARHLGKVNSSRTSARDRKRSIMSAMSTKTNTESNYSSFPRVATVTSALRRIFTRDQLDTLNDSQQIPESKSTSSLQLKLKNAGLLEQVIPEADDEHSTINSGREIPNKQHVEGIFTMNVDPTYENLNSPLDSSGTNTIYAELISVKGAPANTEKKEESDATSSDDDLVKLKKLNITKSLHKQTLPSLGKQKSNDFGKDLCDDSFSCTAVLPPVTPRREHEKV